MGRWSAHLNRVIVNRGTWGVWRRSVFGQDNLFATPSMTNGSLYRAVALARYSEQKRI
ncbi:hypothetical protein A2U01_0072481 [Trifolium medium]|uniref:Uncharacterized protein n=1 Tax=Trifolium medium TaxID=97028 RepID=A0A392SS49_9FABA|nr:hypothetical protein [Trifolium medium]